MTNPLAYMNTNPVATQGPLAITPDMRYPSAPAYNPTFLTLNPDSSAAEMGAQLYRAQWDDYKKRFLPVENALMASTGYMDPSVYTGQVNSGVAQTNKAFDSALGMRADALSRYGVAPTAAQQESNDRVSNVNRSAAVVDAANRIRQRIADRDRAIAVGFGNNSMVSSAGGQ